MSDETKVTISGTAASDGVYAIDMGLVPEVKEEPFVPTPELQAEIDSALKVLRNRPFSQRHPELGKMKNCQVCGIRHREGERKCEQKFTNVAGKFEYFREEENKDGETILVPDLRTAIRPNEKPTKRQLNGAAYFHKKRIHPHPSKIKLQFIERVRLVFDTLKFALEKREEQTAEEFNTQFQKDLHRARVVAARQIRKEREFNDRQLRRRRDEARRINNGLKLGRNRA